MHKVNTSTEHGIVVASEYAQVLRMLGNGRLEAMCMDGVKRLCHIRGKMRKKVWVNTVSGGAKASHIWLGDRSMVCFWTQLVLFEGANHMAIYH